MVKTPLISINGETLTPDPLGAAYWPARETLIVSDLHFEKGSSFAMRGALLPPFDTRTTLMRLEALCRRYEPKRVISLGDAFHDRGAEARIEPENAERLEALTQAADWLWILGNHDPEPPARFAGASMDAVEIGSLSFQHEPSPGKAPGEIAGHLHPCARVITEGRSLRRRCFAVGGGRMIMPALGAYTGGLNVLDEAFAPLFGGLVAWVIGAEGVYPVATRHLAADGGGRVSHASRFARRSA
ncbi:MAG: ligase-associated DNA damage response endonuclease PdeM [Pseudomonadota bacterium]